METKSNRLRKLHRKHCAFGCWKKKVRSSIPGTLPRHKPSPNHIDLLRSLSATFEYHHRTNANHSSLGQIHVQWTVSNGQKSSHYILQWHSSKDLQIQQKIIAKNDLSAFIGSFLSHPCSRRHSLDLEPCDEKHFYVINLIIVMDDGTRYQSDQVTLPIPGPPDAPKLWLAKTSDISFRVEWSEPQVHGIPVRLTSVLFHTRSSFCPVAFEDHRLSVIHRREESR